MIIPNNEQKPSFPDNDGVWEYRTFDDQLLGFIFRKKKKHELDRKSYCPMIFKNGKWIYKWHEAETKPLYKAQLLKLHPNKTVLIVEGEKACDAAQLLFPDLVCLTWMSGAASANKADLSHLKGRKICLWPDNDANGYKAMATLKNRLKGIAFKIGVTNPESLGVGPKWDLADFNQDVDVIDLEIIQLSIYESFNVKEELQLIEKQDFPLKSAKGNPINVYENISYLLKFYNMTTRYNTIKKDIEVDIPHKQFTKANKSKLILAEITSLCIKNDVPRIDLIQWIMMIADEESYNPVEIYLKSKEWDGISRIDEFFNTIDCNNKILRDLLVKRWMIGAIATALSLEGLAHPGVLTLCGPQYCGKSSWFKSLLPNNPELILGDHGLNPSDKDSIRTATRFWLTELSEVDGAVRKSDVSAMKSFLTRQLDVYRCPYDRADTEAPRNTAFVATVNDDQFLKDTTGNRRWWIIDVNSMNAHHNLDMQQIWAEFYDLYLKGEPYHLSKIEFELLNNSNKNHSVISSLEELIRDRYNWESKFKLIKRTATQVLYDCGFDTKNGKQEQVKECHKILKMLTESKPVIIRGNATYYLPELNNKFEMPY